MHKQRFVVIQTRSLLTHPLSVTYLLEGSFWRHRESNFLKDLPYFFIISLSSTPVSKVGGSFCKVNINTCSRNKHQDRISVQQWLQSLISHKDHPWFRYKHAFPMILTFQKVCAKSIHFPLQICSMCPFTFLLFHWQNLQNLFCVLRMISQSGQDRTSGNWLSHSLEEHVAPAQG